MRKMILALMVAFTLTTSVHAQKTWDIVIYGPTSAGIAAAVQAKRMGKSVVVVGPDKHLGGLSAGGLGWTDSGNKSVIGGVSREFYQRIKRVYDQKKTWRWQKPEEYKRYRPDADAQWTFEPSIAESVFEDLVREHRIPVIRNEWLNREPGVGVKTDGGKIAQIKMRSGRTFEGKMFLDATYEGDLMAAAEVNYFVGRESNAKYGETLNGVQIDNAKSHQFANPIDPYVEPGNPESGLLPRIQAGKPGKRGEADHRIQAYNFRVCLTREPTNRIPFRKPEGYDPSQYELLLRTLKAGSWHISGKFDMLPNLKTDTNNHGPFSTDNIGMNYDYPEASYERRKEILAEHTRYQQGYFYFVANNPRVPKEQRQWMAEWGLAKDEFKSSENWPHQIYVREARRMVSDFVITEPHLSGDKSTLRSVGMGSYNMDSHNTQRYVDESGHVRNEGDIQVNPGGPYSIDYGAIIPTRKDCTNLFVPVCVSASHIAYGSIRMEPVFMILGQSAATAACIAIDDDVSVQEVDYEKLKSTLLADHQVLEYKKPNRNDKGKPEGIVVDDTKADGIADWENSSSLSPFVGRGYRHDGNANKGSRSAIFRWTIRKTGKYEARISWTAHPNRAANVPVVIEQGIWKTALTVDQQKNPEIDGMFHSLGTYQLEKEKPVTITIKNEGTDGYVIVDAVQWFKK
jgi:hypothetical protein